MNDRQVTTLWSTLIIEELVRQGAGTFCISPGSRSTPLTIAVARNPKSSYRLFPDERAAGFYALGHAKATGMPAVLICTSGTAVANYFPAVVEAWASSVPMIVLSADRPFELLEAGANQTILQRGMFGGYARWSTQLPEPGTGTPIAALLSTIDHAVRRACSSPPGPVHINAPFREPLEPEEPDMEDPWAKQASAWLQSASPLHRFIPCEKQAPTHATDSLRQIITSAERPIMIAGAMHRRSDALAVEALAESLSIPLFADLTSGIRLSKHCRPWQLAFQNEEILKAYNPDAVIHFGGSLIGKQPALSLRHCNVEHYAVIREHPDRFSPDHNVTMTVEAPPAMVCEALANIRHSSPLQLDTSEFFAAASSLIDQKTCLPDMPVNEVSVARLASRLARPEDALFIANSMPARDMDLYAAPESATPIDVGLNRGVSGIDGIISTAAGFSAGIQRTITLLIGDISFLHDLNALSLLGHPWNRVIIIVINNRGGGIFSFLPVSAETDIFEECFATPQDFSISAAARTFGLAYYHPKTNSDFCTTYRDAQDAGRSAIIEVSSSRNGNVALHAKLKKSLAAMTMAPFSKSRA